MASQAFSAQGTRIAMEIDEEYVDIAEVTGFSGPDGSASEIEVTHLLSDAKEFIMGLPDEGSITLNINYLPSDSSHQELHKARAARTLENFRLTFSDDAASVLTFSACVMSISVSGQRDDAVTAQVTLRITGAIIGPWSES